MLTAFTSTPSITASERREPRKQVGVGLSGKEVAWTRTCLSTAKSWAPGAKAACEKMLYHKKPQQSRNKQNYPTLFPFTKLCEKSLSFFSSQMLRLGPSCRQWSCTAHAKHEVNCFPEDRVKFQGASLSEGLVSPSATVTPRQMPLACSFAQMSGSEALQVSELF